MFDATKLLGSLMESRAAPSAQGRLDAAFRQGAQAPAGNPFGALLSQFGGAAGGAGAGGLAGMLGNLPALAQQAFGGTAQQVRENNPVAVGGLGALAGALMGGGRGAIGGGLLAALGSVAFAALQNANRAEAPEAHVPDSHEALQETATLVLRGMIEAVKADGRVDAAEADRLARKLDETGADADARAWVRTQLGSPSDIDGLARDVRTPQQAAQVYAGALMAIEVDTQAERAFMTRLASALALPPSATDQIHRTLGLG